MRLLLVGLLALSCFLQVEPADARSGGDLAPRVVNDRPILDLLGDIEGPDGYGDITGHANIAPDRPITEMTIEEVLQYQKQVIQSGAASSAMGRYQFIRKTLAAMVERHGLDGDQPFDARTQDFLARRMLAGCGFYSPEVSETAIGNCLARTWAALPMISGKKAGRSYYHGQAGNAAKTTSGEVLKVLERRFDAQPVRVASAPIRIVYPDDGRHADPIPVRH